MTIAISLKVNDGVILAADSASSIVERDTGGRLAVTQLYEKANKVFNLRKGLPIGAITWGAGAIGSASIETVVKDLRERLTRAGDDWAISTDSGTPVQYRMADIAARFREFVFDERYAKAFENWDERPDLGFMLVGYSAGAAQAEEWRVEMRAGEVVGPERVRPDEDTGITWSGEIEALNRLLLGFSSGLRLVLNEVGIAAGDAETVLNTCAQRLVAPLASPAMPIQDAIDLAEFLVQTTMGFSRFTPGASTVGGPLEIAAITKHEGFKWVKRKHYYTPELNPLRSDVE